MATAPNSCDESEVNASKCLELRRLTAAQRQAWLVSFFESRREALSRMVAARVDPRLLRRSDLSDIMQESYLMAARRLDDYLDRTLEQATCPPVVWLREMVLQTLCDLYRKHFGAEKRDVRRETSLGRVGKGGVPTKGSPIDSADGDLSVGFLIDCIAADQTSPSEAAVRQEDHESLTEALRQIPAMDREILILRHFEQLDNTEIAELLQITPAAASARYVRAIRRIRSELKVESGF